MIHFASEGPKFSARLLSGTWIPQNIFFYNQHLHLSVLKHFTVLETSRGLQLHQQILNEFFKN